MRTSALTPLGMLVSLLAIAAFLALVIWLV